MASPGFMDFKYWTFFSPVLLYNSVLSYCVPFLALLLSLILWIGKKIKLKTNTENNDIVQKEKCSRKKTKLKKLKKTKKQKIKQVKKLKNISIYVYR